MTTFNVSSIFYFAQKGIEAMYGKYMEFFGNKYAIISSLKLCFEQKYQVLAGRHSMKIFRQRPKSLNLEVFR